LSERHPPAGGLYFGQESDDIAIRRFRGDRAANHANPLTDCDADQHTDSDADQHADSDADQHADSDADQHADSDADQHADSGKCCPDAE